MTLVLDASGAGEAIIEVMPYIWVIIILSTTLYIGLIIFLIKSKSTPWRMLAVLLALLVSLLGVKGFLMEGNEWGIMNSIFFFPILIWLFTKYFLRKKRRGI